MKKIIWASAGLIALGAAAPAMAADLAARPYTKAPPPMVAPAAEWTGWYIGANVGYGIGGDPSSELAVVGPAFPIIANGTPLYGGTKTFDVSSKGVLGGGQFGYNWQASTNAVLGFEADIQGSNIKGNGNCIVTCGAGVVTVPSLSAFPVVFSSDNVSHDIDWFGTVRGRLGYAAGPSLFYVTGGLAYGDVKRTGNVVGITTTLGGGTFNNFAGSYAASTVKTGWTVGGGVESKIASNWSVKAEYLYVDLGSTSDSFNTVYGPGGFPAAGIAATRTDTATYHDHIFRVGLNYLFNAPVVARY
jgi:outer membrane immunogenic protein